MYDPVTGNHEIRTLAQLNMIRDNDIKLWRLMSDISIPSNYTWEPIPSTTLDCQIDGNGHSISGLKLRYSSASNIGFIIDNKATIRNLTFKNVEIYLTGTINFNSDVNIGVIAAKSTDNSIENCSVGNARIYGEATIYSNAKANIGAICGFSETTIKNCHANYFGVAGFGRIGGIVGYSTNIIQNCTLSNSDIGIYHGEAGGIVGYSHDTNISGCSVTNTTINCYNGFPTTSASYYPSEHFARVGGIVGCFFNNNTINNIISNCAFV